MIGLGSDKKDGLRQKRMFLRLHTVMGKYKEKMDKDKTIFLRLHTVMESDKICVLEKGRLVEEGSPKVFKFSLLILTRFYSKRRKSCQIIIVPCWYRNRNSLWSLDF